MVKVSLRGNTIIPAITCDEEIECCSTRMELFYFDDSFRRYPLCSPMSDRMILQGYAQNVNKT